MSKLDDEQRKVLKEKKDEMINDAVKKYTKYDSLEDVPQGQREEMRSKVEGFLDNF